MSTDRIREVMLTPKATRDIKSLGDGIRQEVVESILDLATEPTPPGAIPLRDRGQGLWRIRIRGYRVIYRIVGDEEKIVVGDVLPRAVAYRGYEGL